MTRTRRDQRKALKAALQAETVEIQTCDKPILLRRRWVIAILAIVTVGFTTGMLLAAHYAPQIKVQRAKAGVSSPGTSSRTLQPITSAAVGPVSPEVAQ